MIKTIIHFSDLHIRLFKDHDLYKSILEEAINQWRELEPDRIVFTGDLVHSKNQMTPELIEMVSWILKECSYIAPTIIIPGNHDFLVNNTERLDALSPIINSLNYKNIFYSWTMTVSVGVPVMGCVVLVPVLFSIMGVYITLTRLHIFTSGPRVVVIPPIVALTVSTKPSQIMRPSGA
jgi:hypothetical protein